MPFTVPVALTTAFAHAGPLAPEEIVAALDRAQVHTVVLDSRLDAARLAALAPLLLRAERPVLAVEAPCPAGRSASAQLASPDREEAETAAKAAEASIRLAGQHAARFVVLRLGAIASLERDWAFARDRFLRGQLGESLALALIEGRDDASPRALDGARRAVDRLLRAAEGAGVTLLLRNGRRYVELPSPRELDALVDEFAGAPLAPALDVAAAHLPDAMGLCPLALALAAFAPRAPLVYLGDACGPVGALAPGRGIVDFAPVLAAIAKDAAFAFSPWAGLSVDESLAAHRAVDSLVAARA